MFTGIVEELGRVRRCEPNGLVIEAHLILQDVVEKDSVAVNGACLTVTNCGRDWFRVDVVPETFRCTNLGELRPGAHVNLERSLAQGARLGGHLVQGHVEATGLVRSVRPNGNENYVEVELPPHLRPFVIPKCFIAVNGVSLTVIERLAESFSFALIPYTRQHTNLGEIQPGTPLNLETDIVGRYIVHYLNDEEAAANKDTGTLAGFSEHMMSTLSAFYDKRKLATTW